MLFNVMQFKVGPREELVELVPWTSKDFWRHQSEIFLNSKLNEHTHIVPSSSTFFWGGSGGGSEILENKVHCLVNVRK